jgi:hypothetical protein
MLVLGAASVTATEPAWSQTSQPTPAPTPTPSPALVPGLEHFSLQPGGASQVPRPAQSPPAASVPPVVRTLPTPAPTPARNPRAAVPTPTPTPTRVPAQASPAAGAQPQPVAPPVALPTAVPTPEPSPIPTDLPTAEPLPPVVLPPIPEPTSEPSPAAPDIDRGFRLNGWQAFAAIGGGAATLFLLGWLTYLWLRRREEIADAPAPERHAHTTFDLGAADAPPVLPPRPAAPAMPPPAPASPPPPAPQPEPVAAAPSHAEAAPAALGEAPAATQQLLARASLDIELKPKRAGTNLLSAAVEYQILITNSGDAPARLVTTDVRILTAGAQQDALLQALFVAPIEKPVTDPFDIAPGATAALDGMAMVPRDVLNVMTVEGRALFIPVLAINLRYEWDGGAGQTASSFVIGINRGEGAKMAPFRADGPPRMHSEVVQLAYTVSVRS